MGEDTEIQSSDTVTEGGVAVEEPVSDEAISGDASATALVGSLTESEDSGDDSGASGESESGAVDYSGIELPEGVEIDEGSLEFAKSALDALNLQPEQYTDLFRLRSELLVHEESARADALEAQRDTWAQEVMDDPALGGSAESFEKVKLAINQVARIDGFSEFRNEMADRGLDMMPSFIRLFRNIGAEMTTVGFTAPGDRSGVAIKSDTANVLFGESEGST